MSSVSGVSLADVKLIGLIRRELMLSRDMLGDVLSVVKGIERGSGDVRERLLRVRERREEIEGLQREFLSYLSKVSRGIVHREDWLRIGSKVADISDRLSGIAYRLDFLIEKGWRVPEEVLEHLAGIGEELEAMIQRFELILAESTERPDAALERIKEIGERERRIDMKYRAALFTILDSNVSQSSMLLLLNMAEMLEENSDTLNDAANDLYIILLDMV